MNSKTDRQLVETFIIDLFVFKFVKVENKEIEGAVLIEGVLSW